MSWLKERREQLRISQDDFAARLQIEGVNTSRSAISAWETERNRLPLEDRNLRAALSRVLRMPEREILKRSGYEMGSIGHSEAAERAAHIIDTLSDEKREMAVKMLEAML